LLLPAARGSDAVGWGALVAHQRAVLDLVRSDPQRTSDPVLAEAVAWIEDAFADYDEGYTDPWADYCDGSEVSRQFLTEPLAISH